MASQAGASVPAGPLPGGWVHLDLWVALAGLGVGFVVGLTGMGGGALMTPVLVVVFGVQPLAAVSSDLVAAVVMKPVGGGVHLRRGTVRKDLVRWLALGSVPSAFTGVLVLRAVGATTVQDRLRVLLGVVLLVAAVALIARYALQPRLLATPSETPAVRRLPTVLVGIVGGLVVGMTSVGSGSLMIVALMMLYPALTSAELVGTDLVQAIPLVVSAALGHLLFGDLHLALTVSLLLGSVPGVYVGARVSSRAPDAIVKPTLAAVLVLSALKLLDAPDAVMLIAVGIAVFIAAALVIAWRVRSVASRAVTNT
jgi:uncharacterized membrane protein YfcA